MKITRLLLASGLLLAMLSGCSLFGAPKNTAEIGTIVADAKKQFAENIKASVKSDLANYEKNALKTFKIESREGTDDGSFTVDMGEDGEITVEFNEKFKIDGSAADSLTADASILDVIKSYKAISTSEITIKTKNIPNQEDEVIKVNFDAYTADGALYVKLNSLEPPKAMPGLPSPAEIEVILGLYKNKWFKIDLDWLAENNFMVKAFLDQRIFKLDPAKLEKLVNMYMDEVYLKNQWIEIDEGSKESTRNGDVYKMTIPKEVARNLVEKHYDFVIANFELIDDVFDVSGKNNPVLKAIPGYEQPSTESLIADIEQEKEVSLSEFDAQPYAEVPFTITAAGDAIRAIGYTGTFEEDDAKNEITVSLKMHDENHDIENASFNGDIKVTPNDGNGGALAKLEIKTSKEGTSTIMGDVEMSGPNHSTFDVEDDLVHVNADFMLAVNEKGQSVQSLDVNFDVKADDLGPGINGMNMNLDYDGGDNKQFSMRVKTDPRDKVSLNMSADLRDEKGNGSMTMEFDVPEMRTAFNMDGNFKYDSDLGAQTIDQPDAVASAMDLTPEIKKSFDQMMALPVIPAGGAMPIGAAGPGGEEMTQEEMEAMMKQFEAMQKANQ